MTYQCMDPALERVDPSCLPLVTSALDTMDRSYLQTLARSTTWLPSLSALFAAFSQPLEQIQYLLLGESPYPRAASANGYAFWDASVTSLWSETGLSTAVNRATSMRNMIKMMLYARGDLQEDCSQQAIARLDKTYLVQTMADLFQSLLDKGFLLLNASLVYEPKRVLFHAKQWQPFMASVLHEMHKYRPFVTLILLGRIAQKIPNKALFHCFEAEHPYQLSFIHNPKVLDFFQPLKVLDNHANKHR